MLSRLLLRYGTLVLIYGIQATLFLVTSAWGASQVGGTPMSPIATAWLFLNLLSSVGLLGGVWLRAFYHPEERLLYVNHGLSRRLLWPLAALSVWLTAGLGSVALRIYDGRIRADALLQQGQQALSLSGDTSQSWLRQHPWLLAGAGALLLLFLLGWIILSLTGRDETLVPSDDAPEAAGWELKIDSVTHAFGRRQVLKGAWLSCRSGEIVGLLGRNGCGKSTLLQILFGSLKADHSALFVNDNPARQLYRYRGLIAYLPQSTFLPRRMRVRQAIRLFAGPAALARLGSEPRLAELMRQRVIQLSGGERRFLELGLLLALDRPFVLLDEPFSELEPLYKQKACDWISAAAAAGTGLVVTDHDYHQILQVSQRVVLMHQGQTRPVDNLKDLDRLYLPIA